MIYFAKAIGTEFVKIGFTAGDPAKRVADLQTACPHELVVLAAIDGCEQDEAIWHSAFAADRVRGEWFHLTPRLAECIASPAKLARWLASEPDFSTERNWISLFLACPFAVGARPDTSLLRDLGLKRIAEEWLGALDTGAGSPVDGLLVRLADRPDLYDLAIILAFKGRELFVARSFLRPHPAFCVPKPR